MEREDWRDLEAERERRLRDRDRDDYGQADYSNLYGYDPRNRTGYKAYDDGRPHADDPRRLDEPRHYGRDYRDERDYDRDHRRARRDGPSDRVLWAVIMERLDDERRLDLRDVKVEVHDGEVTLLGLVRHKADKRRIEDIADIEGVRNVQNNLRVRERSRWTFL
ncbi:BON domain-containing protein [Phenylobacterium sp.]|jgi:hypothetical protein|uniref:BON domain-containing protein n=1 Tax=Phenylobacterium sp. TaxID=1871053 RepID=UPI002ED8E1CD